MPSQVSFLLFPSDGDTRTGRTGPAVGTGRTRGLPVSGPSAHSPISRRSSIMPTSRVPSMTGRCRIPAWIISSQASRMSSSGPVTRTRVVITARTGRLGHVVRGGVQGFWRGMPRITLVARITFLCVRARVHQRLLGSTGRRCWLSTPDGCGLHRATCTDAARPTELLSRRSRLDTRARTSGMGYRRPTNQAAAGSPVAVVARHSARSGAGEVRGDDGAAMRRGPRKRAGRGRASCRADPARET